MSELLHYFYFLASDEQIVNKAWQHLISLQGLLETKPTQIEDGPVLSRLANSDSASLALSISGHMAVLELQLKAGFAADQFTALDKARQTLEDLLFDAVGESSFLLQRKSEYELRERQALPVALKAGELLVAPEEAEHPRLYLLTTQALSEAKRVIRKELAPLDCFTYELHRELDYNEEQHQSILGKMDAMNKEVAEILYRKGADLEQLEKEVDSVSDIHASMTNYGFLLSNVLHRLRIELSRFEELHSRVVGQQDPFFHGRSRARLKRLLASLSTTREELTRALNDVKAGIDVVKSRVDLTRSRTNLDLQKQISSLMEQNVHIQEEALVMGIAASMVEFFLVLYYGLGVWKILAGEELVHHIPLALKGALIVLFSLAVVAGTHNAAKAVKEKTFKGLISWGVVILAMIALIVGVSTQYLH